MAAIQENRLLARLLATARTVTALEAISAVREAGADSAHLLRARVGAQLADGTFRVLVDGKPMRLALPPGTRPGDSITLKLGLPGHAPTVVPAAPSGAGGTLSATGRFIAHLLEAAPPSVPAPSRPVLERPPSAAADLPERLARTVEDSGLFYESHQRHWVEGGYPLERLRQEPQARLARSRASAAGDPDPQPAKAPAHPGGLDEPAQTGVPTADGALSRGSAAHSSLPPPAAESAQHALEPEQAALVRQQLEILAGRPIAWSGEIWPGQPARWEIEVEDRDAQHDGEAREWTTTLALDMPALGAIGARLTFDAAGVRIRLSVQDGQSLRSMRAALPQLAEALANAGMGNARIETSQHAIGH
jgi:hypothetical protein